MKPFSAILTVMLAASLLLTGCSSSQTESSTPESSSSSQSSSEPDSSAEIPNPVQPVKTAAELAEMGFDIVLPAEAEEIEYSAPLPRLSLPCRTANGPCAPANRMRISPA